MTDGVIELAERHAAVLVGDVFHDVEQLLQVVGLFGAIVGTGTGRALVDGGHCC